MFLIPATVALALAILAAGPVPVPLAPVPGELAGRLDLAALPAALAGIIGHSRTSDAVRPRMTVLTHRRGRFSYICSNSRGFCRPMRDLLLLLGLGLVGLLGCFRGLRPGHRFRFRRGF